MVSAEDRAAFYAIMDEYFASRPHFKPGSSSNTAQPTAGAAATKKPAPPPPARRANPAAAAPSAHAGGPAQDYYSGAQSYQPPAQRYNPPAQTEPPAAPSAENRTYAVALYACPGDLSVAAGEQIELLESISADWWRGQSLDGARQGIVPANYVSVQ